METHKYDWKKDERELYTAVHPQELVVPPAWYFVIDGQGDPNGPDFVPLVEVLYSLSYGVTMSARNGLGLPGYFESTVYPLEGLWDLADAPGPGTLDKNNLRFQLMIRQPGYLTPESATQVMAAVRAKKRLALVDQVRFEVIDDGRCIQMVHLGPYDTEPATFGLMKDFCRKESLARVGHRHREIYLSAPGKTPPEKLKTLLRYPVRDNFSCD